MADDPRIPNELVELWQGTGNPSVDVSIQDQFTPALDLFALQAMGPPTTLAAATAIDDLTMELTSAAAFSVGDYVGLFSGVSGENRFYFGEVISIATNTLTMDTPLDFAFSIGDTVLPFTRDMNVDGSTTSQSFLVQAGGAAGEVTVDITKLVIGIICTDAPDMDEFGDIVGGLTNGVVVRRVDGDTRNIFNFKNNWEIAELADEMRVNVQNNPTDINGIQAPITFAGQPNHGVTIRLDPGDVLEVIIQDDLSSLLGFRMLAQGHVVDP